MFLFVCLHMFQPEVETKKLQDIKYFLFCFWKYYYFYYYLPLCLCPLGTLLCKDMKKNVPCCVCKILISSVVFEYLFPQTLFTKFVVKFVLYWQFSHGSIAFAQHQLNKLKICKTSRN